MALNIETGVISPTDRGGEGILDRQGEASWGESEFKSFIHPFEASRTDVVSASSGHSELREAPTSLQRPDCPVAPGVSPCPALLSPETSLASSFYEERNGGSEGKVWRVLP